VISSYISPKAVKGRPSGIAGRGLLATAPIAEGEIVAIKGGHIVDTATLRSLPKALQEAEIQIADGFHLAALDEDEYEAVMLFLNHSCQPNVGFAGNIVLVAMRAIEPGEELTTDYALFDDYDGAMTCHCGTASCRGTIGGRDWQRPELQRRYGPYFSTYLQQRFAGGAAPRPLGHRPGG
jgi:SET domain-containing protein